MTTTSSPPLSVRLHNPGCMERGPHDTLVYDGEVWPSRQLPYREFVDNAYGFRAIVVCLRFYQKHYKINTILTAIARWSPAKAGNPTTQYAANVARECGVTSVQIIDFEDYWTGLLRGISNQESGQGWFSVQDIAAGISLAGAK